MSHNVRSRDREFTSVGQISSQYFEFDACICFSCSHSTNCVTHLLTLSCLLHESHKPLVSPVRRSSWTSNEHCRTHTHCAQLWAFHVAAAAACALRRVLVSLPVSTCAYVGYHCANTENQPPSQPRHATTRRHQPGNCKLQNYALTLKTYVQRARRNIPTTAQRVKNNNSW